MALFNGTNVVADPNGLRMSKFTTAARPSVPVQGQVIWNTDTRKLEMYDGGYWKQITDSLRPYLYRSVIINGYVMGGYQGGSPWRNANRMVHGTDVCTNLGDVLNTSFSYAGGACSLTKAFQWSAEGSIGGSSATGQAFNMATEANAGAANNMRNGRVNFHGLFKESQFAYLVGGGTADVDVFNLTNETMYNNNTGPDMLGGDANQSSASGFSDELAGYAYGDVSRKLLFSTTVSYTVTDTNIGGSGGQQKGIGSKLGKGWAGNEGSYNGGYNLRRHVFATDTTVGTVAKPIGNCGEENFDMGQDHQYCLGNYDGAQNNRGWRFSYVTETGYELGSGSVRTGVPGGSSANCAWRG